ncbi:hypothetical protein BFP76_08305 [Amylibacter kogurei]|uniref:Uncharacterized protein n=1 Tax=Paramylibacter kogurei TaxID=1889778 RepID=A0A2G5K3Q0_9RHOB|nr:hypothetical protein [Amylibacter kogurei]PIB23530.1 hypothetical protein BFP76_08305 [Amylibacter kogurei]
MTFYQIIATSFAITIALVFLLERFGNMRETALLKRSVLYVLAIALVAMVIWYVLQLLLSLPPMTQALDVPAIMLGMLAALGFRNAIGIIKERAAKKQRRD